MNMYSICDVDQALTKIERAVTRVCMLPCDRFLEAELEKSSELMKDVDKWLVQQIHPLMTSSDAKAIHSYVKRCNELKNRIDEHLYQYEKSKDLEMTACQ